MTSPLGSTFKTSTRTNDALRSLRLRLQAKLNRELVFDDVIWQCVQQGVKHEDEVEQALAAGA
jgi:hypothetical protein